MNLVTEKQYWLRKYFTLRMLSGFVTALIAAYVGVFFWSLVLIWLKFFSETMLWLIVITLVILFFIAWGFTSLLFYKLALLVFNPVLEPLRKRYQKTYEFLYLQGHLSFQEGLETFIFAKGMNWSGISSIGGKSFRSIRRLYLLLEKVANEGLKANTNTNTKLENASLISYLIGDRGSLYEFQRKLKSKERPVLFSFIFLFFILAGLLLYGFGLRPQASVAEAVAFIMALPFFGILLIPTIWLFSHVKTDELIRLEFASLDEELAYILLSSALGPKRCLRYFRRNSKWKAILGLRVDDFFFKIIIDRAMLQEVINFLKFYNIAEVTQLLTREPKN